MNLFMIITSFILIFQQNIVETLNERNLLNISRIIDSFDEFFLIILFIFFIGNLFKNKTINKFSIKWGTLLLIFCFSGFLSFFLNSEGKLSVVFLQWLLSSRFWIIVFLGLNIINFDKFSLIFQKVILFVATLNIFIVILSLISPNLYLLIFTNGFIDMSRTVLGRGASAGIFTHPTYSGFFSLLGAIILFANEKDNISKSMSKKFHLALLLFVAVMSFKAKIVVEVMAILFCFALYNFSKSRILQIGKIIIPIIFIAAFTQNIWLQQLQTYNFINTFSTGGLENARNALHANAIVLANTYFPLGVGFSKYGTINAYRYYSEYYYQFRMNEIWGVNEVMGEFATDTYWPGILGETGYIGFTIIVISFVLLLNIFYKRIKLGRVNHFVYTTNSPVMIAFLVLIISLIESTGSPVFSSNPMGTIVGIFVAAALITIFKQNKQLTIELNDDRVE